MRMSRSLMAAFLVAMPNAVFAAWPVSGIVIGDPLPWRYSGRVSVFSDGAHGAIATMDPWHAISRTDSQGGILWSVDPFSSAGLPAPSLYEWISYASASDGAGGAWLATQDTSTNVVAVHYGAGGAREGGNVVLIEGADV